LLLLLFFAQMRVRTRKPTRAAHRSTTAACKALQALVANVDAARAGLAVARNDKASLLHQVGPA